MGAEIRKDVKGIDRFIFENGLDSSKLHMHISEVSPKQSMHAPHQHEGQEIFYFQVKVGCSLGQFLSIANLGMVFAMWEMCC